MKGAKMNDLGKASTAQQWLRERYHLHLPLMACLALIHAINDAPPVVGRGNCICGKPVTHRDACLPDAYDERAQHERLGKQSVRLGDLIQEQVNGRSPCGGRGLKRG